MYVTIWACFGRPCQPSVSRTVCRVREGILHGRIGGLPPAWWRREHRSDRQLDNGRAYFYFCFSTDIRSGPRGGESSVGTSGLLLFCLLFASSPERILYGARLRGKCRLGGGTFSLFRLDTGQVRYILHGIDFPNDSCIKFDAGKCSSLGARSKPIRPDFNKSRNEWGFPCWYLKVGA